MRWLLPETETRGIDDIDAFLIGQEARIDSPIVRFDAPSAKGEAQTHTGSIRHFVVDGQYGEPYPTSIRFQCRGWREFSNELGYEELLPILDLLIEPHFRD